MKNLNYYPLSDPPHCCHANLHHLWDLPPRNLLKRNAILSEGMFDWPHSGIKMQRFTSKNHVYKNFDIIGIQRKFAAPFPNKMSLINRPPFISDSKEKHRGYSVYSYSRIDHSKHPENEEDSLWRNDQAAVSSANESGHFGRLRLVLFWNKIKQNKLQNSCKNLKMMLSIYHFK